MKATDAPNDEVERALLSAVDVAETPEDILHVAARLEDIGANAAALRLCQDLAAIDPYRREAYLLGLRLARRIDDVNGLTWACKGILSQAWPEQFQSIVDEARLVARATHAELLEQGRSEEAAAFNAELKEALSHDVIIRVSWTGDADLDLAVEEPSGTVCSLENRASAGGGTLLGDAFPGSGDEPSGTVSETYICPQGFSGQYRLLVRRVWGNVSTGHATVDIITDLGRPSERVIRQEVPLTEKDALVVFEVKEGRRQPRDCGCPVAQLRDLQRDVRGQFLGQAVNNPLVNNPLANNVAGSDSSQVLTDLFRDAQRLGIGGAESVWSSSAGSVSVLRSRCCHKVQACRHWRSSRPTVVTSASPPCRSFRRSAT